MSRENTPPQQLLVRRSTGFITERTSTFQFRTGPLTPEALKEAEANPEGESGEETYARYSKDGRFVSVITDKGVNVYRSDDEKMIQSMEKQYITDADFSPLGSFIVTFCLKHEAGEPNLLIWSVATGQVVRALHLKEKNPETWPVLRWSNDEGLLAHLVKGRINFFDGKKPDQTIGHLNLKGLYSFALSPNGHAVACFVPEIKAQPACCCIYEIAKTEDGFKVTDKPTVAKTFFNANAAKFEWSPLSNAVLVTATTDVDTKGESYYGESHLHLLYTDGSCLTVPFGTNKGPIHDAKWSPQGKDFAVIQGYQPAQITLFNAANCTPVRDFGTASRNSLFFSPHGRFLCIGGFGNLAGEMDFWEKNKFKQLGTCQDINGPTSFEWTPDSRNFITSSLFPRRRIDEGFKVWTYYGDLVYGQMIEKLTQVAIRPALEGVYPNRPMSPRLSDKEFQKQIAQKQEAAKPKAYVPPHLRGKVNTRSNYVQDAKGSTGPRKLNAAANAQSNERAKEQAALAAEKKAQKNKERRERRKAAKETEEEKMAREKKERIEKEKAELEAKRANMSDDEALAKKLKKLMKQERQAAKLSEKMNRGEKLEDSQLKKAKGHSDIQKEIAEIQEKIAALGK